jgi:hypothetical protein
VYERGFGVETKQNKVDVTEEDLIKHDAVYELPLHRIVGKGANIRTTRRWIVDKLQRGRNVHARIVDRG